MEGLSRKLIDLYDDIEFSGIKKIACEQGLPPRIKGMKYLSNSDLDKLADHNFALVHLEKTGKVRRFPINDFENTWVSSRYFPETKHELPAKLAAEAEDNLKKACEHFGI